MFIDIEKRRRRCRELARQHYGEIPTRETMLSEAVSKVLHRGTLLLDAGTGATCPLLLHYAPSARFAVGVDEVVPRVPLPETAAIAVASLDSLPFPSETFDLIVSRSVVEHFRDPLPVFRELRRILRPGAKLIFTTPNRYDYVSIGAMIFPNSWADAYLSWVFGEERYDHFPVYYRANTRAALRRVAAAAGLRVETIAAVRTPPIYLVFSPLLFRVGMAYDWALTKLGLDALQSAWLVQMRRE